MIAKRVLEHLVAKGVAAKEKIAGQVWGSPLRAVIPGIVPGGRTPGAPRRDQRMAGSDPFPQGQPACGEPCRTAAAGPRPQTVTVMLC